MIRRRAANFFGWVLVAAMVTACAGTPAPATSTGAQLPTGTGSTGLVTATPAVSAATVSAAAPATAQVPANTAAAATVAPAATPTAGVTQAATAPAATAAATTGVQSVAAAAAENSKDHAATGDLTWDSSTATRIVLNGSSIAVTGRGASASGAKVTITSAGSYAVSGSLADGQIIVDTKDQQPVRLILSGVDIKSSTSAPIYVSSAEKAVIILADGTTNKVSDGESYVLKDATTDEPNAAIFSSTDLTIGGGGLLTVDANYNDGIAGKDGLIIAGGMISVDSVDDGIRGKDYVVLQGGEVTVKAQGDGVKSDNEEDATKGYVRVDDGVIRVTAGGDAITAQTDVLIAGGEFTLTTGGGHKGSIDATTSAKGIKGVASVNIAGGVFTIDAADDAVHSNTAVVIHGGTFNIATGDDGVHADAAVTINGGQIDITSSYEGVESATITINDGDINVMSSDDGLNVAAGRDGSGVMPGPGRGMVPGQRGAAPGAMPAPDTFTASSSYYLHVNGGRIVVTAGGDGVDANGAIEMTGGVVIVNGPTQNNNGALDYDAGFKITGGFLVAAGSSGMAQAPGTASTQLSILLNLSAAQKAGTLVHFQTASGEELLTFAPTKAYQSIAFSSPELAKGSAVDVYFGGTSTGTAVDGLYQGGTYASGTKTTSLTLSGTTTAVGGRSR